MSKRKIYHVVPDKSSQEWKVKLEGATKSIGNFELKSEAVDKARQIARNQGLSQLKIHKRDGVLQTEYTYGKDPKRYPG